MSGQAVFDPTREMVILIEVETESECACGGNKEIYIPACYTYREDPLGFFLVDINLRLFAVSPNSDSTSMDLTVRQLLVGWKLGAYLLLMLGSYIFNDHKRI